MIPQSESSKTKIDKYSIDIHHYFNNPERKLKLRKSHKKITNLLMEFHKICIKYNLKYFCVGGTFIGCMLFDGWIPWDGDIDIHMLLDDYNIFKTKVHELPKHIFFQSNETDKRYTSVVSKLRDINSHYSASNIKRESHSGLQVDIFRYEQFGDIIKPYNNCYLTKPQKKGDCLRNYDYNTIFPVRETKFEDITVYIPNDSEKFIKDVWGEISLLVPIDKRFPHEGSMEPDIPHPQDVINYRYLYEDQTDRIYNLYNK